MTNVSNAKIEVFKAVIYLSHDVSICIAHGVSVII